MSFRTRLPSYRSCRRPRKLYTAQVPYYTFTSVFSFKLSSVCLYNKSVTPLLGTVWRGNTRFFRTYHWSVVTRKNILHQGCLRKLRSPGYQKFSLVGRWQKKQTILIVSTVWQTSNWFLQHKMFVNFNLSYWKKQSKIATKFLFRGWEWYFLFPTTFNLLGPNKTKLWKWTEDKAALESGMFQRNHSYE